MQPDGRYVQREPSGEGKSRGSQEVCVGWAEKRHKEATRLRRRQPKGISRRNLR